MPTLTECWEWQGGRSHGYGRCEYKGIMWQAHRLAYFLTKGSLIEGLELLHLCNNKGCCNPNHLHQDTHTENCKGSRKLTEKEVLYIRRSTYSSRKLGAKFGVSYKTILKVKNGLRYKEMDGCGGNPP